MRVLSIGGGPAGLYLAILLKRADPRVDVEILERNGPDDTFGWGVVFSEETLGNLAVADPPSHAAMTAAFARWNDLTIRDRGEVFRSTGHGFCGLERRRLLGILRARAEALGVTIRHHHEARDPAALARDVDLLVGADGLNSGVRAAFAEHFQPSLDVRRSRYIWLGARRRLPEFTFLFRDHEAGLFQVHAYPFDDATSTFIVETDDATWRRAGLDTADEASSIAFCERLYAEDLAGARLVGNQSRWIQFTTVRNARWHHDNVVLLGDAAHTAHFSIGSGTKLAMEDAIDLAAALGRSASVPEALSDYEARRRPVVEGTQRAAQESLAFFEDAARHRAARAPIEFAFSLLTRSRKITHEKLRQRDPAMIDGVDRWYAARAGVPVEEGAAPPPPMLTPLTLRGLTLENRVVVSPMCMYSAEDGRVSDFHLVHLGARAIGGAGLVITEMTGVEPEGRISEGCAGLWRADQRDAWRRIVDFVHGQSGARIGVQLGHAGRKASCERPWVRGGATLPTGWEVIAPSALPFGPGWLTPRAMDRAVLDRVRDAYARSARYADEAGFDLIELHMAHGYLLATFLSPLANLRDDEYGGSKERRMRYPLEVYDAVRAAWPSGKPISVRISATDWVEEGGFTLEDAVAVARAFKARGCDLIDVSSGHTSAASKPVYARGFQVPMSERVRQEAGIATIAVGGLSSHDEINSILAAGRADLVALAREHLRDPSFTLRAAAELGWDGPAWPPQYLLARPTKR